MKDSEEVIKEENKLALLQWLIERNENFRASYSSRAALILSANTLVLATIAFLLDKVQPDHPFRVYIHWWIYLTLAAMYLSFVLAFMSSATFFRKNSSAVIRFFKPRYLFNPGNTIRISKEEFDESETEFKDEFDVFKDKFNKASLKDIIEYACEEVWAGYKLQQKRYQSLKLSIIFLLISASTLIVALWLAFLA